MTILFALKTQHIGGVLFIVFVHIYDIGQIILGNGLFLTISRLVPSLATIVTKHLTHWFHSWIESLLKNCLILPILTLREIAQSL